MKYKETITKYVAITAIAIVIGLLLYVAFPTLCRFNPNFINVRTMWENYQ